MEDTRQRVPYVPRPPALPMEGGGSRNLGAGQPLGGLGILPPWLFPAANAVPIFASDTGAVVGAGAIVAPAGLAVIVPNGRVAVIRSIQIFIDAPTLATVVRWAIRVNGVPVPGLNALTIIGRLASSISETIDELAVIVPEQGVIDVLITDVDGAAYTVGAQYSGWHWDKYAH